MPPPTVITLSPITPAAAGLSTSTVGEPSVSSNGQEALFSGNWYTAHSTNGGHTWNLLSPFSFFPPAAGGFCCDQSLMFIPKIGMHVWILQYLEANGSNVLRIAYKSNNLGTASGWKWWDFVPTNFNSQWSNEWFDYNHCAVSDNFLYVGTNMYRRTHRPPPLKPKDDFTRATLFRIPFTAFTPGVQLTVDHFSTTTSSSLHCVQGAASTLYFGSHEGGQGNKLRVFAWPESSPTVTSKVIPITTWNGATPYGPVGPGGANWIGRCDGRITGAWLAKGTLGFMWAANRQGNSRPFPFVRVVRIAEANMTRIDEPDIWSSTTAFAYPDACPNADGDIGVTLFAGGNQVHPVHMVGVRTASGTKWNLRSVAKSTNSPTNDLWGDYLTCRRDHPNGAQWVASGFSLQGGSGIANVVPHFVRFKV